MAGTSTKGDGCIAAVLRRREREWRIAESDSREEERE
jgi:hypothetical protein